MCSHLLSFYKSSQPSILPKSPFTAIYQFFKTKVQHCMHSSKLAYPRFNQIIYADKIKRGSLYQVLVRKVWSIRIKLQTDTASEARKYPSPPL